MLDLILERSRMARPLTRAQAAQNRAFLKALRRTGNVRLAAREVGAKYGTMQHRRKQHPAFAVRWDAALVFAQARFNRIGRKGPQGGVGTHALTLRGCAAPPLSLKGRGASISNLWWGAGRRPAQ
jgi:hypothetical protein